MPAVSKAQWAYMEGVSHGSIKPKGKLTRAQAAEYVRGQSPRGLPRHAKKKGTKRGR